MLQLGAEAVFVGSGIFKSEDPEARAKAIVKATTYFKDPQKLLEKKIGLGITDGDNTEIVSGDLKEGDKVVTDSSEDSKKQAGHRGYGWF